LSSEVSPRHRGPAWVEAARDRISLEVECHNRDRAGSIPRGLQRRWPEGNDDIDLSLDQLRREGRQRLGLSTGGSNLECYRLALDEARVEQT